MSANRNNIQYPWLPSLTRRASSRESPAVLPSDVESYPVDLMKHTAVSNGENSASRHITACLKAVFVNICLLKSEEKQMFIRHVAMATLP